MGKSTLKRNIFDSERVVRFHGTTDLQAWLVQRRGRSDPGPLEIAVANRAGRAPGRWRAEQGYHPRKPDRHLQLSSRCVVDQVVCLAESDSLVVGALLDTDAEQGALRYFPSNQSAARRSDLDSPDTVIIIACLRHIR